VVVVVEVPLEEVLMGVVVLEVVLLDGESTVVVLAVVVVVLLSMMTTTAGSLRSTFDSAGVRAIASQHITSSSPSLLLPLLQVLLVELSFFVLYWNLAYMQRRSKDWW